MFKVCLYAKIQAIKVITWILCGKGGELEGTDIPPIIFDVLGLFRNMVSVLITHFGRIYVG
jgi:hypothetical protein